MTPLNLVSCAAMDIRAYLSVSSFVGAGTRASSLNLDRLRLGHPNNAVRPRTSLCSPLRV